MSLELIDMGVQPGEPFEPVCTCEDRDGDDYYCNFHGGDGCWVDLKVKSFMLLDVLGEWIIEQPRAVRDSAARAFGKQQKELGQTLSRVNKDFSRHPNDPTDRVGEF